MDILLFFFFVFLTVKINVKILIEKNSKFKGRK
jgi:hypothetical protein